MTNWLMIAFIVIILPLVVYAAINNRVYLNAQADDRWKRYVAVCEQAGGKAVEVWPKYGAHEWQCIGREK